VRFWDTSAIGPLLWEEDKSLSRIQELEIDPLMVVWWGTPVEIESALTRRRIRNEIDHSNEEQARARLKVLSEAWVEIEPFAGNVKTADSSAWFEVGRFPATCGIPGCVW